MNIALVITRSDAVGGAQVHLLDLAARIRDEGHEINVLVGGRGTFVSMLQKREMNVVSLKYLVRPISLRQDFFGYFEIRKHLKTIRPDLVHLHSSKAGLLGRLAAASLGIPSVFTVHGWSFTEGIGKCMRVLAKSLERMAGPYTSRIITVSQFDRELALQAGIAKSDRIVAIQNGVPDVDATCRAKVAAQPPKMIMVARFGAQKDHILLLEALSVHRDEAWSLEFVGEGEKRDAVEHYATELGIRNRIKFSGACDNVPERLASAQIFLLVSNWEGFPLVTLEAMRAGLPVIVSDVGGAGEAVADGETGFLVLRGDKTALADRIGKMLANPDLRMRMGQAGRALYERNFSFDVMFEKTMAVYDSVLNQS